MPHVELPGGSAELRDPGEVTEAGSQGIERASLLLAPERRKVFVAAADDAKKSAALATEFNPDDYDAMKALEAATVLAFVRTWVYSQPVTVEGLKDLPKPVYDGLVAAVEPLAAALRPDVSPSTDPLSPTPPSNA